MTERVVALLTSHNRVAGTLACLEALMRQDNEGVSIDAVLCDAGSSDGTAERVRQRFPSVVVLEATSDVFWNAGMRRAFEHAAREDYDFYLWLNDDTILDGDAMQVLLATYRQPKVLSRHPAIIVGAVRDPESGSLTYGGVVRTSRLRPLRFQRLPVSDRPVQAEAMNGNCVLVPRDVVRSVGLLDSSFSHGMGDFDYALRARMAGASVWVAPGTVGVCAANPGSGPAPTLRSHFAQMTSPKGLPFREWARFTRRWGGPLWPLYAISPFVRRTLAWMRMASVRMASMRRV